MSRDIVARISRSRTRRIFSVGPSDLSTYPRSLASQLDHASWSLRSLTAVIMRRTRHLGLDQANPCQAGENHAIGQFVYGRMTSWCLQRGVIRRQASARLCLCYTWDLLEHARHCWDASLWADAARQKRQLSRQDKALDPYQG